MTPDPEARWGTERMGPSNSRKKSSPKMSAKGLLLRIRGSSLLAWFFPITVVMCTTAGVAFWAADWKSTSSPGAPELLSNSPV